MVQKTLVLVDGSGYLFRAFHALPPLTNAEGMPTGAVYGVLNMLRRLAKQYPDADTAVFFDPPGKTQRHDLFPDYKANRGSMPEDLVVQIKPLQDLIRAQGYPLNVVPGYEADDVIATVAKKACESGLAVVIVTGDKDFAQLVDGSLTLVDTMYNKHYDRESVKEKFGVYPEHVTDYLALVGDTSDNIPGVEKVGPKTALKWLDTYGDLAGVIKNAAFISGKVGENLRQSLENLRLYKQLVTIDSDVPLPFSLVDLSPNQPDDKFLQEQYLHLGFKAWHKELQSQRSYSQVAYMLVSKPAQCQGMVTVISQSPGPIAILGLSDTKHYGAEVNGLALVVGKHAFYVPIAIKQNEDNQEIGITWSELVGFFRPILQQSDRLWVGVDVKTLLRRFYESGAIFSGSIYDVSVMGYVQAGPGRLSLPAMALDFLKKSIPEQEEVFGKGAKVKTVSEVGVDNCAQYLISHAQQALALYDYFSHLWTGEKNANAKIYDKVEKPLVAILAQMENKGVLIDQDYLVNMSQGMQKRLVKLEQDAHAQAGVDFNLASPKQLQEVLYDRLGLSVLEKTPTGMPSTSESVLSQLAEIHPLPGLLLEHRSLAKLKSTYVDALPRCVSPVTGRVHCAFQQTVTATGRLSCTDPNLQNIPIRTEDGRKIRQAFIASARSCLVGLDYSQIELRIMAHISQDVGLLDAFSRGADVHRRTASDVFGVSEDSVSSEQRRFAKVINFGLIYGMSAYGLARQLAVTRDQAQGYIDAYFQQYPGVKQYMQNTRDFAREHGYVETLLGRKLYLPDINAQQAPLRKQAERAAINAPMQGTASELIKLSMHAVQRVLSNYSNKAFLILQVHDELVFEVDDSIVEDFMPQVKHAMESVMQLKVPLLVSTGMGSTWGMLH
ncbi:MAG: DNA polymerase I [Pseudomonadota bacterium]|nr:DNA polymerase I [Pseudomonadota bacterium]